MKRMPTVSHPAPLAGLALRCQSDARLVTLCREGQERAFEEIVRRYRQPLVSFAGAIVPAHRAEDVVQEALTKAHGSLVASRGEMSLKPWLYTIVRNRALNDLRDEPAHQPLDEDFDGVPQPPEVAAQRSELAAVLARVKGLPTAQREALVRRELEGRSHQEIAAAIGVTPGAVRGLIFRARCTLRDATGALIPLPALRALLNAGPMTTETTGAGLGGAAAGLTAGGGGGIAIKAGTALLVAGLAVGSGVALHDRGDKRDATAATVARSGDSAATRGMNPVGESADGSGQGGRADRGGGRAPGSGDDSGHGSPAPSGGPGASGHSGSSGGERGGGGGARNSGSGGGDDGSGGGGDEGSGGSHNGGDETVAEHAGSGETSGGDTSGGETSGGENGGTSGGDGSGSGDDGTSSGDEHSTSSHDGVDATSNSETLPEQ